MTAITESAAVSVVRKEEQPDPDTGGRPDSDDAHRILVKPKLRGWLHAVTFPVAVWLAIFLTHRADTGLEKAAVGVFAGAAALMFGVSSVYHIGRWRERGDKVLHRFDHSNIFLLIAGTTTPFALLLPEPSAKALLTVAWGGALAGIVLRCAWMSAPQWLYVPVYVALGAASALWFPGFWQRDPAAAILIAAGALLYVVGAVVYAAQRPNPSPRWFGFHEIFHVCTVAGFGIHCVGAVAITQLPAM